MPDQNAVARTSFPSLSGLDPSDLVFEAVRTDAALKRDRIGERAEAVEALAAQPTSQLHLHAGSTGKVQHASLGQCDGTCAQMLPMVMGLRRCRVFGVDGGDTFRDPRDIGAEPGYLPVALALPNQPLPIRIAAGYNSRSRRDMARNAIVRTLSVGLRTESRWSDRARFRRAFQIRGK